MPRQAGSRLSSQTLGVSNHQGRFANMNMTPALRKFVLTGHVGLSVGLLGAIASFLAISIAGLSSEDTRLVSASYLVMKVVAQFVIVPLAFATLFTGFIEAVCTPWGLFRHYWVLAKLVVTGFATIILLVKLELVSYAARLAAEATLPDTNLHFAGIQLAVHSAGGLAVLFVPLVLSIYKPRGLTSYGQRKQAERKPNQIRSLDRVLENARHQLTAPAIAATILIIAFLLLHMAGNHFGSHGR